MSKVKRFIRREPEFLAIQYLEENIDDIIEFLNEQNLRHVYNHQKKKQFDFDKIDRSNILDVLDSICLRPRFAIGDWIVKYPHPLYQPVLTGDGRQYDGLPESYMTCDIAICGNDFNHYFRQMNDKYYE